MAKETLDDLLTKITPKNQHLLLLDGTERGKEGWVWEAPPSSTSTPVKEGSQKHFNQLFKRSGA